MSGTIPGWTGSATNNGSYVPGVQSLVSQTFALDYPSNGNKFSFRNGDGMRLSRTIGGSTTNYLWSVASGLPQILDDGTQYVPDLGAAAFGQITPSGMYYFLPEGLGSTVAVIDGSGTVQQTYSYDAFGKATAGTNKHPMEYQFGGQQADPNGMQALRARYYDPSTGWFMSS